MRNSTRLMGAVPLLGALLVATPGIAAGPPRSCTIATDPTGDVILANGDHFDDPTRDITRVDYWLTPKDLVFEIHVVDLQAVPSKSLGDFARLEFQVAGQYDNFLMSASRRLVNTGTPHNSDYAADYPADEVKATATWDAEHDVIRIAIDRASAEHHAKRPIRLGTRLIGVLAVLIPAVIDDGTPAWADWAGKPGSNRGIDITLRRC